MAAISLDKKQHIRGFLWQLGSFFVIFMALGAIIYGAYAASIYHNADHAIDTLRKNWQTIDNGDHHRITQDDCRYLYTTYARADVVYFDDHGEVITDVTPDSNQHRHQIVDHIRAQRNHKRQVRTDKIGDSYYREMTFDFREDTLLELTDQKQERKVGYAVVLVDVTDTMTNFQSFRKVLLGSFGSFGLIALGVSYWISRKNMVPIVKSWSQQQMFVDSAAHELRTPLAVIQGKLETMLTRPETTVREQSSAIILSLSEIRRLNALTSNMLMLARTSSNMIRIEKKPTNIGNFLTEIIAPYQEMAELEEKKVILSSNVVPQCIAIDKKRIHQLLVILLDNALKYSEAGAIISVSAGVDKKKLILNVADTGVGVSDAAKSRIFDRFYREDDSGNRETGGTGLGLSIADWIVRAHDGRITVIDNIPTGTIFRITLPI